VRLRARSIGLAGAALLIAACGGKSPSSPGPAPSSSVAVAATPTPPPAIAGYSATCSTIGYGKGDSTCTGDVESAFLADVEDAIDTLVSRKPEIFDFRSPAADGGLRVVDIEAYYQGVADILGTKGLCAAPSFGPVTLLVKRTNEFSETFVILSPRNSVRKGPSVFAARCSPAEFPLTAEDAISYIRVAFFGIECPPGVEIPPLPWGRLPQVCTGYVTATPKDRGGLNVPSFIHGPDITWELRSGDGRVVPRPVEVPFNYALVARAVGNFSFCATVKGVTGCLDGRVTQVP
jgi:hypothetical protein